MNTELVQIPRSAIVPSPSNPRQVFDLPGLEELAASIRQVGILAPLVVRPLNGRFMLEPGKRGGTEGWFVLDRLRMKPGGAYDGVPEFHPTQAEGEAAMPRYELVAGERRWRAAELAGLEAVPALVRDLTDAQAAELQIVENLQRRDISAMEEAHGFRRLLDLGAYTADTLAERLGKSRSHVFARLRLCGLCDAVRQALAKGTIEASVAELLAKFPTQALQEEALAEITHRAGWLREDGEPCSFRRARQILDGFYPALAAAPWKPKEEGLPGGPCALCPKRSGNMPDRPEGLKGPNVCTDRHCFRARVQHCREAALAKLVDAGTPTLPTLAEHEAVFEDGAEDCPGYRSGYALEEAICYDAAKPGTTWGKLAKATKTPPLVLISPTGAQVRVVPTREVLTAAKGVAAADLLDPAEARRAKIEENRRERAALARVVEELLAHVESMEPQEYWARQIPHLGGYHAQKALRASHGDEIPDQVAALRSLPPAALIREHTRVNLADGEGWRSWDVKSFADHLGFDFEQAMKTAVKAVREEGKGTKVKKAKGGRR